MPTPPAPTMSALDPDLRESVHETLSMLRQRHVTLSENTAFTETRLYHLMRVANLNTAIRLVGSVVRLQNAVESLAYELKNLAAEVQENQPPAAPVSLAGYGGQVEGAEGE